MSTPRRPIVAVIGPAEASASEATAAFEIGRGVAQQDWVLITGGRGGVMEAASHGAREAGGLVLGILPGVTTADANVHVQVAIVTGLAEARNAVIALTADALVAVGRGYGTLSEIAFGLRLGKHVLGIDTWPVNGAVESVPDAPHALRRLAEILAPRVP